MIPSRFLAGILFAAVALVAVPLSACDTTDDTPPVSNGTNPPRPDTGGPCGDGRIIRPGEQCP